MTLERPADGPNFNRRYATGTIRAPLPGVETAGLKSAAAHAAKTKVFFLKCPDISYGAVLSEGLLMPKQYCMPSKVLM